MLYTITINQYKKWGYSNAMWHNQDPTSNPIAKSQHDLIHHYAWSGDSTFNIQRYEGGRYVRDIFCEPILEMGSFRQVPMLGESVNFG
jgi:hypothetical protein